jgi:hypothetical protein
MRVGHTDQKFRGRKDPMSTVTCDDGDGLIWYDGGLMPWRDANLDVLTHPPISHNFGPEFIDSLVKGAK